MHSGNRSGSATNFSRRNLLRLIGIAGGSALMYQAMSELGYAKESGYAGRIKLHGDPKGTSVLILGAGLAGLCAAFELRNAGYQVRVLEYNNRPGGRNWSIRGGDTIREMGGFTQQCQFDPGLYFNPGPWRIPHHHHALLDYCRRFNVALEPFVAVNYNTYVQTAAGKLRYREVESDFNGHVAELLAKATNQGKLDELVAREDRDRLLEAMRGWGALDANYEYARGLKSSARRGFETDPGGGLASAPVPSQPVAFDAMLKSGLWRAIAAGHQYDLQSTLFQPVGGMDMIGRAFGRELADAIQYNCKVTSIDQDDHGVTVTHLDSRNAGEPRVAKADWCICTIPASILGQIPLHVGQPMKSAIDALAYDESFKAGLQFKRRFWEEDDDIYGGTTFTELPIALMGYPSSGYFGRKGVLMGAYTFGPAAFQLTALAPEERMKVCVENGQRVHPQYAAEFETGVSVGWYRVPWTLGCYAVWTDELRERHYNNLCAIDGRIALAGEHASRLPGWQEGALLSALDITGRLHQRVMKRGA